MGPKSRPPAQWPEDGLEFLGQCPICAERSRSVLYDGLTDQAFYAAPGAWRLYQCQHCNCAYLDPRPSPESIYMAYEGYYTHEGITESSHSDLTAIPFGGLRCSLRNGYLNQRYAYSLEPTLKLGHILAWMFPKRRVREDRLVRHLRLPSSKRPRLLDVGCGDGTFLKQAENLGWHAEGIDPDPIALTIARRNNLAVRQGTMLNADYPEATFDAVTMSHVIEHLHDPIANIRACYRVLRPGGFIWVATPNLLSCGHERFGRYWRGLEPPRHLTLLTPLTLRNTLGQVGFRALRQRAVMRARWYYAASNALRNRTDGSDQLSMPLRLRFSSWIADIRSLFQPDRAEELVLTGQKPADE